MKLGTETGSLTNQPFRPYDLATIATPNSKRRRVVEVISHPFPTMPDEPVRTMRNTDKRLAEVGKMLLAEYREGYADGIAAGLQSAEHILVWFKVNPTLVKPKTVDELVAWSEQELANLRSKLPTQEEVARG